MKNKNWMVIGRTEEIERKVEKKVAEALAGSAAAAAAPGPGLDQGKALRARPHARAREVLIFTRHVRKWEFAKQEWNEAKLHWMWVRSRDGGSYICDVGQEVATMAVPPPPRLA